MNITSSSEMLAATSDIANYVRWDWSVAIGQTKQAVVIENDKKICANLA